MLVTGFKLLQRLAELKQRRDTLTEVLPTHMKAFPGEDKDPEGVFNKLMDLEVAICKLQDALANYNQQVRVPVGPNSISLQMAIKLMGAHSRLAAHWATAAKVKDSGRRYSYSTGAEEVRDNDKTYALRTITPEQCVANREVAMRNFNLARTAIGLGNAKEIDIDLDPSLFED